MDKDIVAQVQDAVIHHQTLMIVDPTTGDPVVKIIQGQIMPPSN